MRGYIFADLGIEVVEVMGAIPIFSLQTNEMALFCCFFRNFLPRMGLFCGVGDYFLAFF